MFNKKVVLALVALVLAMLLFSACGSTQVTDTGVYVAGIVDTSIYTVTLKIEDLGSHQTLNGSMYGTGAYTAGTIWQDGKGLVRGIMLAIEPSVTEAHNEGLIIIKTTDLKVLLLQPGDEAVFYCIRDFEPVCGKSDGDVNTVTVCRDLWEFDYCRLVEVK